MRVVAVLLPRALDPFKGVEHLNPRLLRELGMQLSFSRAAAGREPEALLRGHADVALGGLGSAARHLVPWGPG